MEEVDESTSESGITEVAIVDFPNSPHLYNKKAYAFKVAKDDTNLLLEDWDWICIYFQRESSLCALNSFPPK